MKRSGFFLIFALIALVGLMVGVFLPGFQEEAQIRRVAFDAGQRTAVSGQESIFANFPPDKAAKNPEDFFVATSMGFLPNANGEVDPEYEAVLQKMARFPLEKRARMIRLFVSEYSTGWQAGNRERSK